MNARLRILIAGLVRMIPFAALCLSAAGCDRVREWVIGDVVRARRIEVVGESGKVLARFDSFADVPSLELYDGKGDVRAQLSLGVEDRPAFTLYDPMRRRRATLDLGPPDGNPALRMYDSAGKERAAMLVRIDGTPGFAVFDVAEHTRAALEINPKGEPRVFLNDSANVERAELVLSSGSPGLVMFDATGEERALQYANEGESGFVLHDASGALRAMMVIHADGTPTFALLDPAGKRLK